MPSPRATTSAFSGIANATTPLAAPSGVTGPVTGTTVNLSWTNNSTHETGLQGRTLHRQRLELQPDRHDQFQQPPPYADTGRTELAPRTTIASSDYRRRPWQQLGVSPTPLRPRSPFAATQFVDRLAQAHRPARSTWPGPTTLLISHRRGYRPLDQRHHLHPDRHRRVHRDQLPRHAGVPIHPVLLRSAGLQRHEHLGLLRAAANATTPTNEVGGVGTDYWYGTNGKLPGPRSGRLSTTPATPTSPPRSRKATRGRW